MRIGSLTLGAGNVGALLCPFDMFWRLSLRLFWKNKGAGTSRISALVESAEFFRACSARYWSVNTFP